jgi:hypothetical protein
VIVEAIMFEIMIRCPNTSREIFTGVLSDPGSFALTSFFVSHVSCPACGQQHRWSKSDAWLNDSRPSSPDRLQMSELPAPSAGEQRT